MNHKRPAPILSQENHDEWFTVMRLHFQAEGIWHSVMGVSVEDVKTVSKDDAKAQYTLYICIGEFDRERIREHLTAKDQWAALKKRYSQERPAYGRQYLQEFVNYKMPADGNIEEALIKLQSLARRIGAANPAMKAAFGQDGVLQQLLTSLPAEYSTVRDAIDRGGGDLDDNLRRLKDKEAELRSECSYKALVARSHERHQSLPRSRHRSSPRYTLRSFPPRSTTPEKDIYPGQRSRRPRTCFACKGEDHRWGECPYISENMDQIRTIILDARKRKKEHRLQSKARAHIIVEASSDSENSALSYSGDEERAALTTSSNLPSCKFPVEWIADTGATSHMTDQLHLFSSPLRKVSKRSVRVGGNGNLSIKGVGTVQVQTKGGVMNLANVLYVPDLGVNLLSGTALCNKGLKGSFDKRALYMHDKSGGLVLKAVKQGGIYIVNRVSHGLQDTAFASHETNSDAIPAVPEEEAVPDSTMPDGTGCASRTTPGLPSLSTRYQLWHRRFSHMGEKKLSDLHKITTLQKAIHKPQITNPCEVCELTKMRNRTNRQLAERKTEILDLVSVDICGPLPVSLTGTRYFMELVDNHSRYIWVIPCRDRIEAVSLLERWRRAEELATGRKLKAVRSDNAPELKEVLDKWCGNIGIEPQYTIPYTSSQNGVAERNIQTTENNVRAMLKDAELPLEFWDEAARTDAYLRNRTAVGPEVNGQRITPKEAFVGTRPSIDHLRVWGCKCYSYVPPKSLPQGTRQDKLMDRGRVAVFMGYEDTTNRQYRIYAPDLGYTTRSIVVHFDEGEKGGSVDLKLRIPATPNVLPDRNPRGRPKKAQTLAQPNQYTAPIPVELETAAQPPSNRDQVISPQSNDPNPTNVDHNLESPIRFSATNRDPGTRLGSTRQAPASVHKFISVDIPKYTRPTDTQRLIVAPEGQPELDTDSPIDYDEVLPDRYLPEVPPVIGKHGREDDALEYNLRNRKVARAFPATYEVSIPKSYTEAVNDPIFGAEWSDSATRELDALWANKTFEECVPPEGSNVISARWVFDVKYADNGGVEKFKARLVARGFSQRYGIDYEDTFAPTMRMDSLRVILAIVAMEDLECHQVDVNNAFTESENSEEIYMRPPEGVEIARGNVLRVLKSLYGLKQAARDWYNCLCSALRKLGFESIPSDPCIFVNHKGIVIGTWVDDLVIAGPNILDIKDFKEKLAEIFKIKDLGEIKKILGLKVTRDRRSRVLYLDQTSYIDKMLNDLQMRHEPHHPVHIPINGYDALVPAILDDERVPDKVYRQFIGSITYVMANTRPDIAFATNKLAQFMADPAQYHLTAVKHLLRYLRSTKQMALRYGPEDPNLRGYSDADYGGDKVGRKSTIGNVFMLAGGAVSWLSRKQRSVATSTTEAEYIAMSTCAKHAVWLSQLLRDVRYAQYLGDNPWTVNLLGDNQSSIALIRDPQIHERSKHIQIAYHNVRDRQRRGEVNITYIPTDEMVADGLTKPLPVRLFAKQISSLGLCTI